MSDRMREQCSAVQCAAPAARPSALLPRAIPLRPPLHPLSRSAHSLLHLFDSHPTRTHSVAMNQR